MENVKYKKEFIEEENEIIKVETYKPIKQEPDQIDFIENQLVILSKQTLDKFLEYENVSDLISLYVFYYYTAKWQKTNQPKCTINYICKGLKWGKDKVIKTRKCLEDIGLIQQIKRINKKGQIIGWYIKINYVWSKEKTSQIPLIQKVEKPEGGFQDTNALSVNNINALNAINEFINCYPTQCPIRKSSTKRSVYNKNKLNRIIKEKGIINCKKIIYLYLDDCKRTNTYIKNFSTFINNFPSLEDFENNKEQKPKKIEIPEKHRINTKEVWL